MSTDEHRARPSHPRLIDAAWWCAGVVRTERCPADRLWVDFSCAACAREHAATFRCAPDSLAGRTLGELHAVAAEVLSSRSVLVGEGDFAAASECACGAPAHHARVVAAAVLRPMLDRGALLIAVHDAHGPSTWLLEDGAAEPVSVSDPGRALSLRDRLNGLELPAPGATATGVCVERGVTLVVAHDAAALAAAIAATLGEVPRVVVRIDATAVRALPELAPAFEAGLAAALVVESERIHAQARAWARARLQADVRQPELARLLLVTERGDWPIVPAAIALDMVQRGVLLAEACARSLSVAADALEDRLTTLQALVEVAPGASFEVEGYFATPRSPDGREGSPIALSSLPEGLHARPVEELAREAAFLFDAAPPWADRARVCPCGAASRVELRRVEWPWNGPSATRPWVVELAEESAVVIALACDRHVRVLPERQLRELNVHLEGGA